MYHMYMKHTESICKVHQYSIHLLYAKHVLITVSICKVHVQCGIHEVQHIKVLYMYIHILQQYAKHNYNVKNIMPSTSLIQYTVLYAKHVLTVSIMQSPCTAVYTKFNTLKYCTCIYMCMYTHTVAICKAYNVKNITPSTSLILI